MTAQSNEEYINAECSKDKLFLTLNKKCDLENDISALLFNLGLKLNLCAIGNYSWEKFEEEKLEAVWQHFLKHNPEILVKRVGIDNFIIKFKELDHNNRDEIIDAIEAEDINLAREIKSRLKSQDNTSDDNSSNVNGNS